MQIRTNHKYILFKSVQSYIWRVTIYFCFAFVIVIGFLFNKIKYLTSFYPQMKYTHMPDHLNNYLQVNIIFKIVVYLTYIL